MTGEDEIRIRQLMGQLKQPYPTKPMPKPPTPPAPLTSLEQERDTLVVRYKKELEILDRKLLMEKFGLDIASPIMGQDGEHGVITRIEYERGNIYAEVSTVRRISFEELETYWRRRK